MTLGTAEPAKELPRKLSIIIPTYNRLGVLTLTLPTLFDQDFAAESYEVIVVVDGSTDGTLEWLRTLRPSCGFRIVEQPNRGPAAARNAGARAAQGQLLLFLDDDILCDRAVLKEHAAAHGQDEPALVFGPVFVAAESPRTLATYMTQARIGEYFPGLCRGRELRWPDDAYVRPNSSLRRSVFLASGGFDERFGRSREDVDLGLRLWDSGVRFRFLPTAVTQQLYVKSNRDLIVHDARSFARNEILLCRKHPRYRPHCSILLTGGPAWVRLARELVLRLPVSPEPLLRLPCWVADQLSAFSWARRAGVRLGWFREATVALRTILEELGCPWAVRAEFGLRVPTLLYHHVGPHRSNVFPGLTISPECFARQVKWLADHGYVGIRPADWLAWCHEGKPLPRKPVLLTFDDAYADLAEHAFPVLRHYGFQAAVYVVTGQVGRTNSWDERQGWQSLPLMAADDIRRWASQGVEFGAHGRTHTDLRTLTPTQLEEEIRGSEKDLAEMLDSRVLSFAYPYGAYSEAAREAVRSVFQLAFTTDRGLNDLHTDLHRLRRTRVLAWDSLCQFACHVHFGRAPLESHRMRLALAIQRLRRHLIPPRSAAPQG
jgi:peptidoglycan/xylan/chitin deacetylase (PgdA/CDA1 family)/GT2 family glycosyltransferase